MEEAHDLRRSSLIKARCVDRTSPAGLCQSMKLPICIHILMLAGRELGQRQADVQTGNAYYDLRLTKGTKGDINGAFA
jgi:hypothetical protein